MITPHHGIHRIQVVGHAGIIRRSIERIGLGTIAHREPVGSTGSGGTHQLALADLGDIDLGVGNALAPLDVDADDDILKIGLLSPQKLPGSSVQGPDDTRFAGNPGDHFAARTGGNIRIYPGYGICHRGDLGFHHDAFEGMILIPVTPRDMLKVPDDFPGIGIQRQGRVGIQHVTSSGIALDRAPGNGHRHPHENQVELGIITGRHPRRAAAA